MAIAALLRSVATKMARAPPRLPSAKPRVDANLFSSYTKHKSSVKSNESTSAGFKRINLAKPKLSARKKSEGLDRSTQGDNIDLTKTLIVTGVLMGGGYLYKQAGTTREMLDKIDKIEKEKSELKQKADKEMAQLKAQLASNDESLSRYRKKADMNFEEIQSELRYLKLLLMASVFQKGVPKDSDGKGVPKDSEGGRIPEV